MPGLVKEKIYGYVDLTDEMRAWIRDQYITHKRTQFASGWRVIPAHHRENPNHGIIMRGYADVEDSNLYWFDDPDKRDNNNDIKRLPLALKTQRDKEYFREENAKQKEHYGFFRYKILESRKSYVEEYVPEKGLAQVEAHVMKDAIEVPMERPAHVVHDVYSKEILDEAAKIVEKTKASSQAPKRSKTETRLKG